MSTIHTEWMQRALELAARGEGLTRPNPPVGAVVVKKGRIIGEGWHRRAGGPHAEPLALRQAGSQARGSTIYITLEPCSTHGRTPPCTERILEAGVREVVIGAIDPNPQHAGRALRILRRRGVKVVTGICKPEATALIEPFARMITTGRPWVTIKLGMTLDGKIADARRQSKWITGAAARRQVQAMRRRADAVLVGAGTISADDPSLWPRPAKGRTPWRVVVDTQGITNPNARVYTDEYAAHTIVALGEKISSQRARRYARQGCEVLRIPESRTQGVEAVCRRLAELGALHVLCEGGGELAAALLEALLVDEWVGFIAPRILGGVDSVCSVGGAGWLLPALPQWRFVECTSVGPDVMLKARPVQSEQKRK